MTCLELHPHHGFFSASYATRVQETFHICCAGASEPPLLRPGRSPAAAQGCQLITNQLSARSEQKAGVLHTNRAVYGNQVICIINISTQLHEDSLIYIKYSLRKSAPGGSELLRQFRETEVGKGAHCLKTQIPLYLEMGVRWKEGKNSGKI